ncbi:hypothetical protein [Vibrio sp.]|uniref:hypothetical protein n=1 Tax=Vibrio sp. TaxID=678 RepID=UPI003AA9631F
MDTAKTVEQLCMFSLVLAIVLLSRPLDISAARFTELFAIGPTSYDCFVTRGSSVGVHVL